MPPGGLPFLFRQEREERSRGKGVAERSESSNKMIAGGNHTLTIATGKCIPLENPPAANKMARWEIRTPKMAHFYSTSVSIFLGSMCFPSGRT